MTLEELFQQLSYGELSNLAMAVDASGAIKKEKQNQIVHFANEALLRLHSRFALNEGVETIALTDGVDLDHVLDADVLLVTSLLTPYGQSLSIGDRLVPYTIYVHGGILHIPAERLPGITEVQATYQKRHATLDPVTTAADLAQVITLVPELYEALTSYIAAKAYGGMNSPDALQSAAIYRARYEQVLSDALNQGLLPGELLNTWKLDERGFV